MYPDSTFNVANFLEPKDSIIVHVNMKSDIFSSIFSKFEINNAFSYIKEAQKILHLPEIYAGNGKRDVAGITDDTDYQGIKEKRRLGKAAAKSTLDGKLLDDFVKFMPDANEKEIITGKGDLFLDAEFRKRLDDLNRNTILFTGFFTEIQILRTAFSCADYGYFGVVVSDATSTYSERIYYEALDVISQAVEVVDTRDLMRIWVQSTSHT